MNVALQSSAREHLPTFELPISQNEPYLLRDTTAVVLKDGSMSEEAECEPASVAGATSVGS